MRLAKTLPRARLVMLSSKWAGSSRSAPANEGAKLSLIREVEVAGARADGRLTVGFNEVNDPIVEQLEVHQDARHSLPRLLGAPADEACQRECVRYFADNLGAVRALELGIGAPGGADGCNEGGHD